MSSENQGTPEDDDPFAYLYRGEGTDGASAQETAPLPGVPRTSYHQATQVGRTQYGQPQQAPQGYQAQPQLPHQEQPTARYTPQQSGQQAPPYGAQPSYQQGPTPPAGGGRAGNRAAGGGARGGRGVMIGTVAVIAVVVVAIIAVALNSGGNKSKNAGSSTSSAPAAVASAPSTSATPSTAPTSGSVPPADAATMTLTGGAKQNNNWKGALGAGGNFVDGMTNVGATVTWTVTVPAKGDYYLWIRFANATGKDAATGVTVNQKPLDAPITLKDYGSNGKWTSWFSTFRTISLNQGQNTVALSCTAGATCTFNLDQLALTPPVGGSSSRPTAWK